MLSGVLMRYRGTLPGVELVRGHLLTGASADTLLDGLGELARAIYVRPDWFALADCRRPENQAVNFFPTPAKTGPAREVCARCDARYPCREDALRDNMRKGIWGGTDETERATIRAERDAEVA